MHYELSDDAEQDLLNIETYLIRFWNPKVLENFIEKFENGIEILLKRNVYFEKYENTNLYKYLLTKHNTLIYSYNDDVLLIHRILQNFQDPEENFKSIMEE